MVNATALSGMQVDKPMEDPARHALATMAEPRVPVDVLRPPAALGLHVNEVFTSIQGEGASTGRPTTFLRTMGCHLRCGWCDTTYSFHEGSWMAWDDLIARIEAPGIRRLCLTGGEPLLQRDAWPLVRDLLAKGWEISIETSGSIVCAEASQIAAAMGPEARARLCLSMDVKCPGSGEERSWKEANLAHLGPSDQLKFIIADAADYEWARDWVRAHSPLPCDAWFHPVGGTNGATLRTIAERMLEDRLDVRLGVQLHKLVWGETRGV